MRQDHGICPVFACISVLFHYPVSLFCFPVISYLFVTVVTFAVSLYNGLSRHKTLFLSISKCHILYGKM